MVGGVIKLLGNGGGVGHMVAAMAARHVWWRRRGLLLSFGVVQWLHGREK